ncbi:MAG: hypothetical protein U0270_43540 [Labilithrix sp.]
MRAALVVLVAAGVGCLSDPKFDPTTDLATTSDPALASTDDMVFVPATTFSGLSTMANAKESEDDKKGKKPKPAPAPAPATTATPAPTASGALVVPAFWIDAAAVHATDYAACRADGPCTPPSCPIFTQSATCVTRAQAAVYCAWKRKRLVRNDEWNAAVEQSPPGLTGLSDGIAEWVDGDPGTARGGATSSASVSLGLDSSIPTLGFRCARDR